MVTYFDAFDARALLDDYPLGAAFTERYARIGRDELRAIQETRFLACVARAWEIPFYRRLWSAAGIEAGDIRGLDDLGRIPAYTKADLMESVRGHPPFGDFHGIETFGADEDSRPPVMFHTTSGTTAAPQPLFFAPKTREVQNIMMARAYLRTGLRAGDVVHSVFGFGAVNAGHYAREAITHFTNALVLTAGTGAETRSREQVRLMQNFGATAIIGFADYIRTLAEVAREEGIEPGRDIPVRVIWTALGRESRAAISAAWGGAAVYDVYGVGDTGVIAAEGPEMDGLTIWEDAHLVEIIDEATKAPLADGEPGNICVTALFKDDVFPNIRFDTNDRSAILASPPADGSTLRRLTGFLGRSDNMVKLRGINVYPTAVGEVVGRDAETTGEFLCEVTRVGPRDEMTVHVETAAPPERHAALAERLGEALRERIGVALSVAPVAPGTLAPRTGIEARQKPIRLIDGR